MDFSCKDHYDNIRCATSKSKLTSPETAAPGGYDEPLDADMNAVQEEGSSGMELDGAEVIHNEPSTSSSMIDAKNEMISEIMGFLNPNHRSFTPPPIATLAPGTPGTIKRMKNRFGKIPGPIDTSKGTVIIPASSQANSSNTAESGFEDTTSPEDHFDELKSSSLPPQGRKPTKAATINTLKRSRKAPEKRTEADGVEQPVGFGLRKRSQTAAAEAASSKMPPPSNPRRSTRSRSDKDFQGPAPLPHRKASREGQDRETTDSFTTDPSTSVHFPPSQEVPRSSVSEVEDALDDEKEADKEAKNGKGNEADSSEESSEAESDEEEEVETAQTASRDVLPGLSLGSFRSLTDLASQRNDLFLPTNSQPQFLLKPVKSFENNAVPDSQPQNHDEDSEETSSESESKEEHSVIPKERRAGSKTTKRRGGLASIQSFHLLS